MLALNVKSACVMLGTQHQKCLSPIKLQEIESDHPLDKAPLVYTICIYSSEW
jgi:hypothetical protein